MLIRAMRIRVVRMRIMPTGFVRREYARKGIALLLMDYANHQIKKSY